MLKRNRSILTAIGLVLILTIAMGWFTLPNQPNLKRFQYGEPRNEHYRAGGSKCDPAKLSLIKDPKIRLYNAEDCQKEVEEYRQHSDDLVQQTRAANAAEAQTDIAGQVLWMGWFQTLGGLLTLAAAIAAAIYAREAAKEGRRSVQIADANYKAFVIAEAAILDIQFEGRPTFFEEAAGRYMRFKIEIINIGRTVAFVTGVRVEGSEAVSYSFISKPGEKSTFEDALRVDIGGKKRILGYVQYSTHAEINIRRLFRIELKAGLTPNAMKPVMFPGAALRREHARYEKPFEEQIAITD